MADNLDITQGTGTTVATDDVGGVHYQKVKLAIGANDTANLLAVGAGNVDTGTPRFTLADDDPSVTAAQAIQAAVEDTATINVAHDTSVMKLGAADLTPKFAAISSTGSGDTVALVASKKIRVLSMFLVAAAATTVKFQSGASSDKTGAMSFAANGGISLPYNPVGWFETAAGEKLNHVLGSSVAFAGGLTYIEV